MNTGSTTSIGILGPCIADVAEAFVYGELDAPSRLAFEEHVQSCATCASLVAAFAGERSVFAVREESMPQPPSFFDVLLRMNARTEGPSAHPDEDALAMPNVAAAAASNVVSAMSAVSAIGTMSATAARRAPLHRAIAHVAQAAAVLVLVVGSVLAVPAGKRDEGAFGPADGGMSAEPVDLRAEGGRLVSSISGDSVCGSSPRHAPGAMASEVGTSSKSGPNLPAEGDESARVCEMLAASVVESSCVLQSNRSPF